MNDHPKTMMLKRGGKYRRAFFVQPYLNTICHDIWRLAFIGI